MKAPKKLLAFFVVSVTLAANLAFLGTASAGTLTHTSVIEVPGSGSAMIAGAANSVIIEFTPATTGAPSPLTVTFTGWTGGANGSVNATQTAATGSCTSYTGATAMPGVSGASGSGAVVTITGATSLTAGTNYCTTLTSTSAVTNPTATGVYPVTISTGSDSQTVYIDVLSTGANAYSITGTVGPTFTMSLSGTTDAFSGNLSSSATTTSTGITTTINTNAATGWFVWAEDSNGGLHSTQAGHTIASVATTSNHTFTTGTEQYGLGVSAYNTANYAYGGGTTGAGLSSTAFNEIATNTSAANGATFVTHELADILSTTQPATDYTDTITLIGAGSF